jgi:hypothetical protein
MFFAIFWAAYIPIGVMLVCIVGEWLMPSLRWRFGPADLAQQHQPRAGNVTTSATRSGSDARARVKFGV